MFDKIDYDNWARKPYFDQYFNQMKCTYSISVNLDISRLMNFRASNKVKLHPVLVYIPLQRP